MEEKYGEEWYGIQMRRRSRQGLTRGGDGGPSTGRAGPAGDGGGAAIPAPAGTQREQDAGAGTGLQPEELGRLGRGFVARPEDGLTSEAGIMIQ